MGMGMCDMSTQERKMLLKYEWSFGRVKFFSRIRIIDLRS